MNTYDERSTDIEIDYKNCAGADTLSVWFCVCYVCAITILFQIILKGCMKQSDPTKPVFETIKNVFVDFFQKINILYI